LATYAHSPECDQARPGAVVYPAVRDREPCEPRYLPPPALDFDQALAWAVQGGREVEAAPVEVREPEAAEEPGVAERPHAPTAAEQAWAAARARLQRELSREVFTAWLQDVTLVSADAAAFTLGVRHAYARDWLEARLRPAIGQTLREVLGHAVEVQFVVPSTEVQA